MAFDLQAVAEKHRFFFNFYHLMKIKTQKI